jgi:hypothetical protein
MLCPSSFGQNGATSRDRATLFDHFVGDLLDMVRHVRPNALAASRLVTSSNFVGCSEHTPHPVEFEMYYSA